MNINLSIKQIEQLDLVSVMKEILSASGVNPHNIILELTETAALKDYDRLRESLQNMKKLGVQIALDDFGTGYSSLYLLRAAPFDHIKIDMSYTADIFNKDGSSAAFISLVTDYAHAGGRTICAEGIETAEQRSYLASENVDKGQGYYFSKPLSGSALFELLKRKVKVLPESAEQKKDCP